MLSLTSQSSKKLLIILHDLAMSALAIWLAFVVRFEGAPFDERIRHLPGYLPAFLLIAFLTYRWSGLYQSKWRFASLPDISNIVRAVTILAGVVLIADYVLVSPQFYGFYFFGKITIAVYWLLQVFLLGGPRIAYRYLKYHQGKQQAAREELAPILVLARPSEAEVVLRAIETGSIRRVKPLAILSPRAGDVGQVLRGVPLNGTIDDLGSRIEDFKAAETPVKRLIATSGALAEDAHPEQWLKVATRLGLQVSRLDDLTRDGPATLAPIAIEDLLLRPSVQVDRARLSAFFAGKRVAVTGGGGSIGSEICLRSAAFGAANLLVIENSEPALFHVSEALAAQGSPCQVEGALADVRDRERLDEVLAAFRPDVVVHAAALKHVPYLEAFWSEGLRTNVFGSVNAMEAAAAAGARIFVMISTDKAVEPVSMLGATKRMAEICAQARDARSAKAGRRGMRLIAVRFGNVLGSAGSVVPKFKAQIARGGPVTVTHPDMIRYFMTIREACDLVLTAAAHQVTPGVAEGRDRTAVYVLKMGQQVRIMELAERMIRLAGLEPHVDIPIETTGIRPGERLNEILFGTDEPPVETGLDGIMAAKPASAEFRKVEGWLKRLQTAITRHDRKAAEAVLAEAIPEFRRAAPPQA